MGENLIDDGKLEKATKYAESNINAAKAIDDLENQSFSYVYKIFKESNFRVATGRYDCSGGIGSSTVQIQGRVRCD